MQIVREQGAILYARFPGFADSTGARSHFICPVPGFADSTGARSHFICPVPGFADGTGARVPFLYPIPGFADSTGARSHFICPVPGFAGQAGSGDANFYFMSAARDIGAASIGQVIPRRNLHNPLIAIMAALSVVNLNSGINVSQPLFTPSL